MSSEKNNRKKSYKLLQAGETAHSRDGHLGNVENQSPGKVNEQILIYPDHRFPKKRYSECVLHRRKTPRQQDGDSSDSDAGDICRKCCAHSATVRHRRREWDLCTACPVRSIYKFAGHSTRSDRSHRASPVLRRCLALHLLF